MSWEKIRLVSALAVFVWMFVLATLIGRASGITGELSFFAGVAISIVFTLRGFRRWARRMSQDW